MPGQITWPQAFYELALKLPNRRKAQEEAQEEEDTATHEPATATPMAMIECAPAVAVKKKRADPHVIVFDTETTGLRCRIVVQLAYTIFENDGAVIKQFDGLLRLPKGHFIGREAQRIHHISNDMVRRNGLCSKTVLERFVDTVRRVVRDGGRCVAHNASFDVTSVNRTLAAFSSNARLSLNDVFCTMRQSGAHLIMYTPAGRRKYPTNSELFEYLTKEKAVDQGNLHDASVDIKITARSYFEGRRRRWWW